MSSPLINLKYLPARRNQYWNYPVQVTSQYKLRASDSSWVDARFTSLALARLMCLSLSLVQTFSVGLGHRVDDWQQEVDDHGYHKLLEYPGQNIWFLQKKRIPRSCNHAIPQLKESSMKHIQSWIREIIYLRVLSMTLRVSKANFTSCRGPSGYEGRRLCQWACRYSFIHLGGKRHCENEKSILQGRKNPCPIARGK